MQFYHLVMGILGPASFFVGCHLWEQAIRGMGKYERDDSFFVRFMKAIAGTQMIGFSLLVLYGFLMGY